VTAGCVSIEVYLPVSRHATIYTCIEVDASEQESRHSKNISIGSTQNNKVRRVDSNRSLLYIKIQEVEQKLSLPHHKEMWESEDTDFLTLH
jgi:hypothetical protein